MEKVQQKGWRQKPFIILIKSVVSAIVFACQGGLP
jgi:hypothetical protein